LFYILFYLVGLAIFSRFCVYCVILMFDVLYDMLVALVALSHL